MGLLFSKPSRSIQFVEGPKEMKVRKAPEIDLEDSIKNNKNVKSRTRVHTEEYNFIYNNLEFNYDIKEEVTFAGELVKINKSNKIIIKSEEEKDIEELVSYDIINNDNMEDIRSSFYESLVYSYSDRQKYEGYLESLHSSKDIRPIRLLTISCFNTIYQCEIDVEILFRYIKDNKTDISSLENVLGKECVIILIRSMVRRTYDENMRYIKILNDYFDGTIDRSSYKMLVINMFVNCYIQKYGYKLSTSYISLIQRIANSDSDKIDKQIAIESYRLMGIYSYNIYSINGMVYPGIFKIFNQMKHIEGSYRLSSEVRNVFSYIREGRRYGLDGSVIF